MQLVVEPAGVADGLALVVPPPKRGGGGAAVGAAQTHSAGRRLEHGALGNKKEKKKVVTIDAKVCSKNRISFGVIVTHWRQKIVFEPECPTYQK